MAESLSVMKNNPQVQEERHPSALHDWIVEKQPKTNSETAKQKGPRSMQRTSARMVAKFSSAKIHDSGVVSLRC